MAGTPGSSRPLDVTIGERSVTALLHDGFVSPEAIDRARALQTA